MTAMLMLLLQAAMPAPEAVAPTTLVATTKRARPSCEISPESDEIVVCGKARDEQFRLRPIPRPAGMKAPIDGPGVNFDIGNAHGNVYAATVKRQDGVPDNRVMMTLRMPF